MDAKRLVVQWPVDLTHAPLYFLRYSLADFGLAAEFPESKGPLATLPAWMDNPGPGASSQTREGKAVPPNKGRDVATSFVGTAEYLVSGVLHGNRSVDHS